jgi:DNA repair protein RecN (Recombination protein N)
VLDELVVHDLGVIERGEVVFGPGMTALTGETGAGKTLVVEAISLLLGGRADAHLIRAGSAEARVDGRFHRGADEIVLSRVIPRSGRSRAYINGHPVPVAQLQELGESLLDLHGQHAHQSLTAAAAQRNALDAFGGIDLESFHQWRTKLAGLRAEQIRLGGDHRAREREMDVLRFQLSEIAAANIVDDAEDDRLRAEEDLLSDSVSHQEAAQEALEDLDGEGGAGERIGNALRVLANRAPFSEAANRLKSVAAELRDAANDFRAVADRIEPDPQRLEQIRQRRTKLKDLQRKYGDSLASVLLFADENQKRLADLELLDTRAGLIDAEIAAARVREVTEFDKIVKARAKAGRELALAIEARLGNLAMASARMKVDVESELPLTGDGLVTFLLAANPGSEPAPLAKVASGGELARIMLALRLALLDGRSVVSGDPPDTLLFDEVDAGIGGAAAVAVGLALADMAVGRQVLVVTHLPQVAACANQHVRVSKSVDGKQTRTTVASLDDDERVNELARMLAGSDSATARQHAAELLAERKVTVTLGSASPRKSKGKLVPNAVDAKPKKVRPAKK